MPATTTVDFEREFAEIVRALRAVPSEAPAELRERVRALGEPERRRAFRFPRVSRRAALVLVPACVLAVLAASAVRGLVVSSTSTSGHRETFSRAPGSSATTPQPPLRGLVHKGRPKTVYGAVTTTPLSLGARGLF